MAKLIPVNKTVPVTTPTTVATTLTPLHNNVFVTEMDQGNKLTKGGLIILDDNMGARGIRPRWAKIFAIGPDVKDVAVGEWVLIEHGRWSNRIPMSFPDGDVDVWRIDYPAAVLIACDDDQRLQQTAV